MAISCLPAFLPSCLPAFLPSCSVSGGVEAGFCMNFLISRHCLAGFFFPMNAHAEFDWAMRATGFWKLSPADFDATYSSHGHLI
ncbi:hypothetical protein [Chromobacterium violaceum]